MSAIDEQEIRRLLELAALLRDQRRLKEALDCASQALNLARATLGEDHPATATSLGNLAELYKMMGNLRAAEPLARQAVAIFRRMAGDDHPILGPNLNNLAVIYESMGNFAAAEPLLQQALAIERKAFGDEHPGVAISLDNLATVQQKAGNYTTATSTRQQALAVARRTLGEHHPTVATILSNLATLYRIIGGYRAAEPLARQALAIRRNALGEEHPHVAHALDELALLYQATGNYAEAEPLHRQALAIATSALGEDHYEIADYLSNLAQLYRVKGDYAAAEPLYRQALAIRRKTFGDGHPAVSGSLNNLALLYGTTGDYRAAEPLYLEALAIERAAAGEQNPEIAIILDNLATLYQETGEYRAAAPLRQEALAIARKALGDEHPDVADNLNNLALLHYQTGDFRAAESLYRQALTIQRQARGEKHPAVAVTLNNLALLHRATGDYRTAGPLYRQALAIRREALGEEHPDVADTLNNLAVLSHVTGEYSAAMDFYRQALAIQRKVFGEGHAAVATSMSNLATLWQEMGVYAAAESLNRQALGIRRTVLGETHPDIAFSLNELATGYCATGDFAAAEPLYRQALLIRRQALGETHPHVAVSLDNLAVLCAATGRVDEAKSLMQEASAIVDATIWHVFSIGSERQRMAYLSNVAGTLDGFLSLVVQHFAQDSTATAQAFDQVLRRKGIGAETLAVQREEVLGGHYPALKLTLREVALLRGQIARKTLTGPGPEGADAHSRQLDEWNAHRERLEGELARQIPEVDLEQRLRASRGSVAMALPEGSALVEFIRCEVRDFRAVSARGEPAWQAARYLAFVLPTRSPDGLRLIDLGEAERIDSLIATFRAFVAVRPERRANANTSAGADLRKKVFDPLLPALGTLTQLFLAPDGDLSRLAFEVLPSVEGGFLIDDYQISYLSAGRDILRLGAATKGQPGNPLVVACPDFDLFVAPGRHVPPATAVAPLQERHSRDLERGSLHFSSLERTRQEGEHVAGLLGVTPWLDKDVLKARLKSTRSPRVMHVATHGFFLPNRPSVPRPDSSGPGPAALTPGAGQDAVTPFGRLVAAENPLLRSGLALAGVNTWARCGPVPPEAEDGLLTADDVAGLDLLATELVVLSACETGLGEVRCGEGVFGLRRSFVVAGAKTLVMSLWRVPDEQTLALMENFYHQLMADVPGGTPRAAALRTAQRALKGQPATADPYFWGAFVCQGDPGPLPSSGSSTPA